MLNDIGLGISMSRSVVFNEGGNEWMEKEDLVCIIGFFDLIFILWII